MREALGDGYTEALRKTWKGDVPESADFVMFWWRKAAELVRDGKIQRFGFITTNSIHQTFNRRVIEPFLADPKKPLHLAYAIPDHPRIDSADGAAVRIAMTVGAPGKGEGSLELVTNEEGSDILNWPREKQGFVTKPGKWHEPGEAKSRRRPDISLAWRLTQNALQNTSCA